MVKLSKENCADFGYLLWRPVGDGYEGVGLLKMLGRNYRLQRFNIYQPLENYCFHSLAKALHCYEDWNPEIDKECPAGWVKHIETNRCRVDGDPARESIGWPRE